MCAKVQKYCCDSKTPMGGALQQRCEKKASENGQKTGFGLFLKLKKGATPMVQKRGSANLGLSPK